MKTPSIFIMLIPYFLFKSQKTQGFSILFTMQSFKKGTKSHYCASLIGQISRRFFIDLHSPSQTICPHYHQHHEAILVVVDRAFFIENKLSILGGFCFLSCWPGRSNFASTFISHFKQSSYPYTNWISYLTLDAT